MIIKGGGIRVSLVPQRCHVPLGAGAAHADRIKRDATAAGGQITSLEVRPLTGWQTMAMATDWSVRPRQVPGASYRYAHTTVALRRLRRGADKLASPVVAAGSPASTPWTC